MMGKTGKTGKRGKYAAWRKSGRSSLPSFPAFFLLVFLVVPACSGPRQKFEDPSPRADGFELTLNNRHWLDVNVFVQHDGEASRVTLVTASSSQSLILPLWMLGESKLVRIIAEPVGEHDSYTTDLLRVDPGQAVELNVESVLSRSNYSIQ